MGQVEQGFTCYISRLSPFVVKAVNVLLGKQLLQLRVAVQHDHIVDAIGQCLGFWNVMRSMVHLIFSIDYFLNTANIL